MRNRLISLLEREKDIKASYQINQILYALKELINNPNSSTEMDWGISLENFKDLENDHHDRVFIYSTKDEEENREEIQRKIGQDPSLDYDLLYPSRMTILLGDFIDRFEESSFKVANPMIVIEFYDLTGSQNYYRYAYNAQKVLMTVPMSREEYKEKYENLKDRGYLGEDKTENAFKYLEMLIESNDDFYEGLVHELSHMLDSFFDVDFNKAVDSNPEQTLGGRPSDTKEFDKLKKRARETIKDPEELEKELRRIRRMELTQYINDPIELEAHFRETSHKFYRDNKQLFDQLESMTISKQDKKNLNVKPVVKKLVSRLYGEISDQVWFTLLTDENKKRIRKRIYSFIISMSEKNVKNRA